MKKMILIATLSYASLTIAMDPKIKEEFDKMDLRNDDSLEAIQEALFLQKAKRLLSAQQPRRRSSSFGSIEQNLHSTPKHKNKGSFNDSSVNVSFGVFSPVKTNDNEFKNILTQEKKEYSPIENTLIDESLNEIDLPIAFTKNTKKQRRPRVGKHEMSAMNLQNIIYEEKTPAVVGMLSNANMQANAPFRTGNSNDKYALNIKPLMLVSLPKPTEKNNETKTPENNQFTKNYYAEKTQKELAPRRIQNDYSTKRNLIRRNSL